MLLHHCKITALILVWAFSSWAQIAGSSTSSASGQTTQGASGQTSGSQGPARPKAASAQGREGGGGEQPSDEEHLKIALGYLKVAQQELGRVSSKNIHIKKALQGVRTAIDHVQLAASSGDKKQE
jgi:hypothetical protein